MTVRGARLVAATAGLAWVAAALAWLAPVLPEGLGLACAPDLVAREVLAGMAIVALLLGPAFVADEPGRPREDHTGLLAALAAAPAALALALAGGGTGGALLPAAAVVFACDLAASSYLRLDPVGKRATAFAAAAVALLAGVPIVAWGFADLGGRTGAAAAFRISPLLAARDLAGGWEAVAPAALLLVAAAAVLRLASLRAGAAAAAALLLALGIPAALAEPAASRPVLVVGEVREGPVADLAAALGRKGLPAVFTDGLPSPPPPRTEIVLLGRGPREAEARVWREALRGFLRAGGRAAAAPGPAADLLAEAAEPGILGLVVALPDAGAVPAAADLLAPRRTALPNPGAEGDGVAPAVFRIPFPVPPRSLPGSTLLYLGVLSGAFAATAALAHRRGSGQGGAGLALGALAALGSGLLFLPGLAAGASREALLSIEERAGGSSSTARRMDVVRVERTRAGGGVLPVALSPQASWSEVRFDAAAEPTFLPSEGVRLAAPGRWSVLVGISGGESGPFPAAPVASLVLRPGDDPDSAFNAWRRDPDPRLQLAGESLRALLRPPPGAGELRILIPTEGPLALIVHDGP